jgi:hypothetical protein
MRIIYMIKILSLKSLLLTGAVLMCASHIEAKTCDSSYSSANCNTRSIENKVTNDLKDCYVSTSWNNTSINETFAQLHSLSFK